MVTIITNQNILQKNLTKFCYKKITLFTVVIRLSVGTAVVFHNKRWWTSFLSLIVSFIWNLLSLLLTPIKFIKYMYFNFGVMLFSGFSSRSPSSIIWYLAKAFMSMCSLDPCFGCHISRGYCSSSSAAIGSIIEPQYKLSTLPFFTF